MRYRVFDTDLGAMAVGWTDAGISRVLLPGDDTVAMRDKLERAGGIEDPAGQKDIAELLRGPR